MTPRHGTQATAHACTLDTTTYVVTNKRARGHKVSMTGGKKDRRTEKATEKATKEIREPKRQPKRQPKR